MSLGVNLLVGTENGLKLLDRSGQGKVYPLINSRRFQQMDVLEGLNLLITISGHHCCHCCCCSWLSLSVLWSWDDKQASFFLHLKILTKVGCYPLQSCLSLLFLFTHCTDSCVICCESPLLCQKQWPFNFNFLSVRPKSKKASRLREDCVAVAEKRAFLIVPLVAFCNFPTFNCRIKKNNVTTLYKCT